LDGSIGGGERDSTEYEGVEQESQEVIETPWNPHPTS